MDIITTQLMALSIISLTVVADDWNGQFVTLFTWVLICVMFVWLRSFVRVTVFNISVNDKHCFEHAYSTILALYDTDMSCVAVVITAWIKWNEMKYVLYLYYDL
jgi:hypothetical protein